MDISFLIPSETVRTDSKKTIKSIVGGQERIDVFSRCLLNLYRWKERLNANISLIFYLSHPEELMKISIPLSNINRKIENELDSTREMLKILSKNQNYKIEFEKTNFRKLLNSLARNHGLYYLTPDGLPIKTYEEAIKSESSACFVLGSQYDLTTEQEKILFDLDAKPLSIGNQNYLASHVITLVCYNLSTSEAFHS